MFWTEQSKLSQIAYLAAALSVSVSFPLQIHPMRRSLISLLHGGRPYTSKKREFWERILLSGLCVGLAFVLAVSVSSLGKFIF